MDEPNLLHVSPEQPQPLCEQVSVLAKDLQSHCTVVLCGDMIIIMRILSQIKLCRESHPIYHEQHPRFNRFITPFVGHNAQ